MISAENFIQVAQNFGFGLCTGVPCSYLTPFINYAIDSPHLRYVGATNEGDAVGIASGAELAGISSIVMFQNSGLGNAVNPLTSLNQIFKIPILIILTWRGEPGGSKDEPQHDLMGQITPELLESMQIPWAYFPTELNEIESALDLAVKSMKAEGKPYALIMRKGSVKSYNLNSQLPQKSYTLTITSANVESAPTFSRHDMLKEIQANTNHNDIVLATTGYCGRELYAIQDCPNQFYMVGSMGCISSIGLGIAISKPQQRTVIIDGDGAALMRLGAFATIGYERPSNLLHILLDNQCHESTGGQSTVSHSIDFAAIASACGYQKVDCIDRPIELANYLQSPTKELTFVHVKIKRGTSNELPRPTITPPEVAHRLRQFLQNL
jgi:phosphonopyruvate decarboxylase